MSKKCTKCGNTQEFSAFCVDSQKRDGLSSHCKPCKSELKSKYYKENKNVIVAKSSLWHKENPEKVREKSSKYRARNKDKLNESQRNKDVKDYNRAWSKKNKGKVNSYRAKRRAYKKQATPSWYDDDKLNILAIYEEASLIRSTGVNVEVDHIIPLKNDIVCGLHCSANLQIITREENMKKFNYFSDEVTA